MRENRALNGLNVRQGAAPNSGGGLVTMKCFLRLGLSSLCTQQKALPWASLTLQPAAVTLHLSEITHLNYCYNRQERDPLILESTAIKSKTRCRPGHTNNLIWPNLQRIYTFFCACSVSFLGLAGVTSKDIYWCLLDFSSAEIYYLFFNSFVHCWQINVTQFTWGQILTIWKQAR